MSRFRAWLAELPPSLRWGLLGIGGLLVIVIVLGAAWSWQQRQESVSRQAFGPVMTVAQRAVGAGEPGALDEAARTLTQFLKDHSRSRVAAQAWYLLGGVEFKRRQWEAAGGAFAAAAGRDGSSSVGALSRLGEGSAWESKGDMPRAIEAYQRGLAGRGPQAFLYGDLLLAKARAQEQAKDATGAIVTYKQYLKDLPSSDRADEIRIRLALLGSSA